MVFLFQHHAFVKEPLIVYFVSFPVPLLPRVVVPDRASTFG